MIIVLDSSVLLTNPTCAASWWETFIENVRERGDRVLVSELVVVETIMNHRRKMNDQIRSLNNWGHGEDRLGLRPIRNAAREEMYLIRDSFEQLLRDYLASSGVEIIPPFEFDHVELFRRACSYRKPYDELGKRDGYRDTVHWLTVLRIAEDNPGVDVWWLSDNSGDFGIGKKQNRELHPDLIEDIAEKSLTGKVHWEINPRTLEARIKALTAPVEQSKWDEIVGGSAVGDAMMLQLAAALEGTELNPREIPLPRRARTATVGAVGQVKNLVWSEVARAGETGYVAGFTALSDILFQTISAAPAGFDFEDIPKFVQISGIANFDGPNSLTDVTVNEVSALPGDSGEDSQWPTGSVFDEVIYDESAIAKLHSLAEEASNIPALSDEEVRARDRGRYKDPAVPNLSESLDKARELRNALTHNRDDVLRRMSSPSELAKILSFQEGYMKAEPLIEKLNRVGSLSTAELKMLSDCFGGANITIENDGDSDSESSS